MCSTLEHGDLQVGIFQSLIFQGDNITADSTSCLNAVEMQFTLLPDDSLVRTLQVNNTIFGLNDDRIFRSTVISCSPTENAASFKS